MTKNPLEPEDILADVFRQQELDGVGDALETPIAKRSTRLFFIIVLALLALFGFRVFTLTILQGSTFAALADRAHERKFLIVPIRGAILDNSGELLVDNEASFAVLFDPLLLGDASEEEITRALTRISEISGLPVNEFASSFNAFREQAEPRVLISPLSQEMAIALAAADLPGFFLIEPTFLRHYPRGGDALSAVLGYVSAITGEELAEREQYSVHDIIGKTGVEEIYETDLRGIPGVRRVLIDAHGYTKSDEIIREAVTGANIRLTIDAELTRVTARALMNAVANSGASGAAAVLVDPRDGAIRALVSVPMYDVEELSRGISSDAYTALVDDPGNPFLNRAVAGLYPSGSTIKPFIASAALAEEIVSPLRRLDASAGFIRVSSVYDPDISWTFRDWKPHGFVNIFDAIARSSNVYFYIVGGGYKSIEGLGPERIAYYLERFGFGKRLGIDLSGEAAGRIPTPAWKKAEIGERWYIGDTYNLSIGQGNLAVTPLQLASATGAIANGGTLYRPHVLDAILSPSGALLRQMMPEVIGYIPVAKDDLATVRRGMRDAVTTLEGTNRALSDLPISSAAKTGSAQFGTEDKTHAIVTAFAPYENPTLALAIVLEGGGQGTVATLVAKEILQWYAITDSGNDQ